MRGKAIVIVVLAIVMVVVAFTILSKSSFNGTPQQSSEDDYDDNILPPTVASNQNMTVYFIDTGQGDSILIQTPDSKNILIDAGGSMEPGSVTDFLSALSISTIDAMIITHPHADHLNYADEVLQQCEVRAVYHSGMSASTAAYNSFISAAQAEGCPIHTDDDISPGDMLPLSANVTFEVLWIDAHASETNDASIVLKVTYGTEDFLFMGDASSEVERQILPLYDLNVEVLKVGHHGSATSSCSEFLAEVSPEVAVICVGAENTYGHPTQAALDRLSVRGAHVDRTDLDGTIIIVTDGFEGF